MADVFTPQKRSAIMRAIKSADTKPEVLVRRLLFASGFRFRLRQPNLPGKPDIVLPKWRLVVFVNGCFWHQHEACSRASMPHSKEKYWFPKLKRNVERDQEEYRALQSAGWRVLVVWECACLSSTAHDLKAMLRSFVSGGMLYGEIGRDWQSKERRLVLTWSHSASK